MTYVAVAFIRSTWMMNLLPLVVVSASPWLASEVKPVKPMVAALAPLVSRRSQDPSLLGAVIFHELPPPFVKNCSGDNPQSTVNPADLDPRLFDVTFAPPERV